MDQQKIVRNLFRIYVYNYTVYVLISDICGFSQKVNYSLL